MCGRIIFRVDASETIGSGHVMRCLAIAQEWIRRGGSAGFLMHETLSWLVERIKSEGGEYIPLKRDNSYAVLEACELFSADLICLDGYQFDSDYRKQLYSKSLPLIVIDDHVLESPYFADVVVNPQPNVRRLDYTDSEDTMLLLGIDFMPMRDEFTAERSADNDTRLSRKHVLINFGGTDPKRLTYRVTEKLLNILSDGSPLDVIVSEQHRDYLLLKRLEERHKKSLHVHAGVNDMAELMKTAKIAISAGGSTVWELVAMHVPSIVVLVADNQRVLERYDYWPTVVNAMGIALDDACEKIVKSAERLLQDSTLVRSYQDKYALFDAKNGSKNICDILCIRLGSGG